jgi:hypothetical protein
VLVLVVIRSCFCLLTGVGRKQSWEWKVSSGQSIEVLDVFGLRNRGALVGAICSGPAVYEGVAAAARSQRAIAQENRRF